MHLNWRDRLQQTPQWRDLTTWPVIDTDRLPRSYRKTFLRNQQIVARALAGEPAHQVADRLGVTPGRVSQLLNRCLGGTADVPPPLTTGLIPWHSVAPRTRQMSLPTAARRCGANGAFQTLLDEVPGLKAGLDATIEASYREAPYAQRLTPSGLFGAFKELLKAAHWPADHYPYTTLSCAYESVRRYLRTQTDNLVRDRQQAAQTPRSRHTRNRYRVLDYIQIDGHSLDLTGRANLMLNDELIPLRLGRACVLVAIDLATECILGYHLALTEHPNQQDLLTLFENCLIPWKPLILTTPGLRYSEGAGFPSGLIEGFPISFGTVQLDNAWAHYAHSVIDFVCDRLGATLSHGLPGVPRIRRLVESVFDYIETHGGHRVPSTTGSYPTDPRREARKNRSKPPLIGFQTINEALSILLSEANVTPVSRIGGATPLALMEHHFQSHYIRYVPPELRRQWHPLIRMQKVHLHWAQNEGRLPHVYFAYARYQGSGLLAVAGKTRQIQVMFDFRDIRALHAFTLDGVDLGELKAPRVWQRFPHSVATRRWIMQHRRESWFDRDDPLGSFFLHLLQGRHKASTNLSLVRVFVEFTQGGTQQLSLNPKEDDLAPDPTYLPLPTIPAHSAGKPFAWHTGMAHHKGRS